MIVYFVIKRSISGQQKMITKKDVKKIIDEYLKYLKEDENAIKEGSIFWRKLYRNRKRKTRRIITNCI